MACYEATRGNPFFLIKALEDAEDPWLRVRAMLELGQTMAYLGAAARATRSRCEFVTRSATSPLKRVGSKRSCC